MLVRSARQCQRSKATADEQGCGLKIGRAQAPLYGGGDSAGVSQGLHNTLSGEDQAEGETNCRQEYSDWNELTLDQKAP